MSYAGANAWSTAGQGIHGLGTRIMQMALQKKQSQLEEMRHGEQMALQNRQLDLQQENARASRDQAYDLAGFVKTPVSADPLLGDNPELRNMGQSIMRLSLAPPPAERVYDPKADPRAVLQERGFAHDASQTDKQIGLQRWQHINPSGNAVLSEQGANTRQARGFAHDRTENEKSRGLEREKIGAYGRGGGAGAGSSGLPPGAQHNAAAAIAKYGDPNAAYRAITSHPEFQRSPALQATARAVMELADQKGKRDYLGVGAGSEDATDAWLREQGLRIP